jgi:hypothetical protein
MNDQTLTNDNTIRRQQATEFQIPQAIVFQQNVGAVTRAQ